jgi:hypothetical protein
MIGGAHVFTSEERQNGKGILVYKKYDWLHVGPSSPWAYKVAYFMFQANYNGTNVIRREIVVFL